VALTNQRLEIESWKVSLIYMRFAQVAKEHQEYLICINFGAKNFNVDKVTEKNLQYENLVFVVAPQNKDL
jgi:hypothetical protein